MTRKLAQYSKNKSSAHKGRFQPKKETASSQNAIWQKRREIQSNWLSKQPTLLKGTESNQIDKFISEKLLNLSNDSGEVDDLAASAYHILEQNCFRCHGNEKKKEDLT